MYSQQEAANQNALPDQRQPLPVINKVAFIDMRTEGKTSFSLKKLNLKNYPRLRLHEVRLLFVQKRAFSSLIVLTMSEISLYVTPHYQIIFIMHQIFHI